MPVSKPQILITGLQDGGVKVSSSDAYDSASCEEQRRMLKSGKMFIDAQISTLDSTYGEEVSYAEEVYRSTRMWGVVILVTMLVLLAAVAYGVYALLV